MKLKVAFFGTSDRSRPILESLKENFDLALCITKKDTRVGRKQVIKESGVKKWAKENGVDFVEIDSLREYNLERVLQKLKALNIEYGIVADFSFIIPVQVIEFFENNRILNIHFSLLPSYRGASPVQFAILNGDETTGITIQLVGKRLDAGAIIYQIGYKLTNNETSGELYNTLFEISADKLPQILQDYATGKITPLPQDEEKATYTYSPSHPTHTQIYKEDAKINWKEDKNLIERKIRAFNPWPVCWSTLKELENNPALTNSKIKLKKHLNKDLTIKIYEAELAAESKDEKIQINTLQLEGKNIISWKEFENGYVEKA